MLQPISPSASLPHYKKCTLIVAIYGTENECTSEINEYKKSHQFLGFALDLIRVCNESYISDDEKTPPVVEVDEEKEQAALIYCV